jgi:hypothetical protein
MTFVAGVRGFDGVLLLTDCRLTDQQSKEERDVGQKVFCLTPNIVIGFSGDVRVAGLIVRGLLRKARRWRRRRDGGPALNAVRHWLPDSIRRNYRRLGVVGEVAFMVGAVTGPGAGPFAFETRLFTMASPNFEPQESPPFKMAAIGMGAPLAATMTPNEVLTYVLTAGGHAVDGPAQAAQFRGRFVGKDKTGLMTGGFMAVVKVGVLWRRPNGVVVGACGFDHVFQFDEAGGMPAEEIALTYDPIEDRWLQENRTASKVVPLRRPWEPLPPQPVRFDDLDEAMRRKRANLTPVPGAGIAVRWHIEKASGPKRWRPAAGRRRRR